MHPALPQAIPQPTRSRLVASDPVVAFVGLGANLGDSRATLQAAFEAIAAVPETTLTARSSLYRSEPVDAIGPDFLNAAARIQTRLSAHALLRALQAIERAYGRERSTRNAPRTLDLDLLLYGGQTSDDPILQLPHPRLHQRAFVLQPLSEIAAGLVIDGHGAVADLLDRVSNQRVDRLATR